MVKDLSVKDGSVSNIWFLPMFLVIYRSGRNIRALEVATGVEIVVDDTPEAIVLSGFDPVRREIARLSLHQLIANGRIHPYPYWGSSVESEKTD